jgi:hypothetical protein
MAIAVNSMTSRIMKTLAVRAGISRKQRFLDYVFGESPVPQLQQRVAQQVGVVLLEVVVAGDAHGGLEFARNGATYLGFDWMTRVRSRVRDTLLKFPVVHPYQYCRAQA